MKSIWTLLYGQFVSHCRAERVMGVTVGRKYFAGAAGVPERALKEEEREAC